jgi:hypothetical protein
MVVQPSIATKLSARNLLFLGMALCIVAAAVYLHSVASLTLPVPWGDEAYFLWQARAFERWNTFVAPELDPSRPIFLLPFVYGTTVGMVFKVFGYSLEAARHFSLALVLLGFFFLAVLVRRSRSPFVGLALIGVFMVGGYTVAMANVARMEAYLFAAVCGVLLLWQRGQRWLAMALLSVTPMIHPNGTFFLLPMTIYAALGCRLYRQRPSRSAIAALVASGIAWAANGLYALTYWDGFMHDTAYRLGETTADHRGLSQFAGASGMQLVAILVTAAIAVRRRSTVVPILVIAFSAWLSSHIRVEQWYEPIRDFSFLLLALAIVELAAEVTAERSLNRPYLTPAVAGIAGVGLIGVQLAIGRIDGPINYVQDLSVAGMRITDDVAYFDAKDRQAIESTLQSLSPGCQVSVEVYPWGDGLLLADLEESRIRFQVPYFDPVYQPANRWVGGYGPTAAPLPDLYLVHVSRYHPRWLDARQEKVLAHALKMTGADRPSVIVERNSTEIWYAIPATAESKERHGQVRKQGC